MKKKDEAHRCERCEQPATYCVTLNRGKEGPLGLQETMNELWLCTLCADALSDMIDDWVMG